MNISYFLADLAVTIVWITGVIGWVVVIITAEIFAVGIIRTAIMIVLVCCIWSTQIGRISVTGCVEGAEAHLSF